jgi:hypothetical protein
MLEENSEKCHHYTNWSKSSDDILRSEYVDLLLVLN